MRQGYFGPPDPPETRRRRRAGRARGERRFDTEQLLRELPAVDPELRRLFTKWSDAKLRSLEATGNGEAATAERPATANGGATAKRPASLRERAPSAPPVRKPPRPRREREAEPPGRAAAPGPAAATVEAAPLTEVAPAVEAPAAPLAEAVPAAPETRSRARGRIALGLALLFYAAATAAAAVVAEDQGGGDTAAAVAGPAEVTLGDDWTRAAPAVPGFRGPGAANFTPPGAGSSLTLGSVEPSATSMLPDALLRELAGPAPRPTIRERLDAWVFTYAGMRLDDRAGRLTVHLISTDRGTAGVACLNGAAACDEAAATLRPAPGATAHRGLSSEYAAALDRAIADLSESRTAARASLSAAPAVAPARARELALDVERAYGLAARRLGGLAALRERPELGAANDRITTALERAGRAYGALAAAAGRADAGSLAASRRTVLQREEDLREALRGLAGLGYRPTPVE